MFRTGRGRPARDAKFTDGPTAALEGSVMAQSLGQTLRTYHRWVSTAAVALLTWVAVTGVALALDVLFQPTFPPPPPPLNETVLSDLARSGVAAAFQGAPETRPMQVEVSVFTRGGQATAEVRLGQAAPMTFVVDPTSGQARRVASAGPSAGPSDYLKFRIALHKLLEKLHRGNIIGGTGQWLSVLTGFSFIFLTVSGVWMYADLHLRRRRLGKRQMFWN